MARASWLTYGEFEDLRDHADAFSALMASQSSLSTWQVRVEGGTWEQARGRLVSDEYFQVMGVRAAVGHVFTTADDRTEPQQTHERTGFLGIRDDRAEDLVLREGYRAQSFRLVDAGSAHRGASIVCAALSAANSANPIAAKAETTGAECVIAGAPQ